MTLALDPRPATFDFHALVATTRGRTLLAAGAALACVGAIYAGAAFLPEGAFSTDLTNRGAAPSLAHPFGTDPLGRDMFARTLAGLAASLTVGLVASAAAAVIATALGVAAALDRRADFAVGLAVDVVTGLPHLVLLVLIGFMLGGGTTGIVIAVAVTHWPSLCRVVRAEVLRVLACDYVAASRRFGRSRAFVATRHVLPHLVPQVVVGTVLLFPHAILHEAGMSFLGFGFEPHLPATGILLAESMRHLTAGLWWLAAMPGLALLAIVVMFERIGAAAALLADPHHAQE